MNKKVVSDTQIVAAICAADYQAQHDTILSETEMQQIIQHPPSVKLLAKRLAAKRALFSCISQLDIHFEDYSAVSILHDDWGKPYFLFSETISRDLQQQGVQSALLSIADEKCTAYAYVVLNLR